MENSSSSHDRDRGRAVFSKGKHHNAYLVIVVEVVRMPEDDPVMVVMVLIVVGGVGEEGVALTEAEGELRVEE